jgi:Uma2 family endonuclease
MSYDHDRPAMLAMGAASAASSAQCPPRSKEEAPQSERRRVDPRPAVDERLVAPGSRHEILGGKLLAVPPADEPHGTAHMDLAAVLRAHATSAYRGAVDMLTRTSEVGDHAPDASIYPQARDAATGGRKLEELAFEIVGEQALSVSTSKARDYVGRGVRRVFCVHLGKRQVMEWSREKDDWAEMSIDSSIFDRSLVRPLPVRALLDAAAVDDALADALIAKKNQQIEAAIAAAAAAAAAAASARALAEALLGVLDARRVAISGADRERVLACLDPGQLSAWTKLAAVATRREEVFG